MKKLKIWFLSKKLWWRGGITGVAICLALFLFNIFVYFPYINGPYAKNIPDEWLLIPPQITGHLYFIYSSFLIPHGFFCKATEPICVDWSSTKQIDGSIPWTLDGQAGYCVRRLMTPTDTCAFFSTLIGSVGIAILLLTTYFILGAIIGKIIEKIRTKKLHNNSISNSREPRKTGQVGE